MIKIITQEYDYLKRVTWVTIKNKQLKTHEKDIHNKYWRNHFSH